MAQSLTQVCTNCKTPVPASMSFCPNCGTPAHAGNDKRTSYASNESAPPYIAYPQQQQSPPVYQAASSQQGYQPSFQPSQPPPAYARPQKNARRGIVRVGVLLCLLFLLLGALGFFALRLLSGRVGSLTTPGTNSEVTPTQAAFTTTPINATVNYASVNITIINAQQATSFADDTSTPAQGIVRLNLHAVQSDVGNVYFASAPIFAYPECFTLLLPGGNKVPMAPGGYKDLSGPPQKGDQTTWIDFPASTSLKVNQMILQIGKDAEEQLQIPLTGHADLSQYQPKQSTPNLRVAFGSMFWTLKTVALKLSDSGTQVAKGTRFLVLTFSIDNPGTEGYSAFPPDFMRLQYGGTTISLEQALIGDAAAGTSNIQGLVSFLVPQDTTAATLILLPGHTPGATSQVTIPFQIP
ncbi:MAG TPA: zinc ribbon domain-containing protein [Ktedonobacteraceae bacterium]